MAEIEEMATGAYSAAIVVAAGSGSRFSSTGPRKQYREIGGVPILERAVRPFVQHPAIGQTVVVLPEVDVPNPPEWLTRLQVDIVAGGAKRGDSVRNGLGAVSEEFGIVLIHDGARPFVSPRLIDEVLRAAQTGAAVPGVPVVDTVKEVDADGRVSRTLDRDRLRRIQTPQGFPTAELRRIHREAYEAGLHMSDDAALFEHFGLPVRVVPGVLENIKVTTPEDLEIAESVARRLLDAPDPASGNRDRIDRHGRTL